MSFKHECKYLSGLVIDYKKVERPFWSGFEDIFKELIMETERKLYLIKEQELCELLTLTKQPTQSPSLFQFKRVRTCKTLG